jgi:uncharacterized sporulation protein YeaH/YhbH (DUF444 family)
MGLIDDLERYREVGEQRRQDLADFITHGDMEASGPDAVRVPVKIVDLPEFTYDARDRGGVGKGQDGTPQPGQPIDPQPDDGDGEGEPGEEGGEHDYYEMDPEEFAEKLDDELGLDLEPKGKHTIRTEEGDYADIARAGPESTLDFERLFKQGLKRTLATTFDEEYVREALRVEGWGPDEVYAWARDEAIPVSRAWIVDAAADLSPDETDRWESIGAMEAAVEREPVGQRIRREGVDHVPFRPEDERYRYPEEVREPETNVVVVNIRDVSGSMRETKRELVERVFSPLDWYLQGKYDNAAFVYIAHDATAWEVERAEFFGITSGGGTRISSAYDLAKNILEDRYPFDEWNRYVFAAGDGENTASDTTERVIPLMEAIDANLHAYVEVQPDGGARTATHAAELESHFGDDDGVAVAHVATAEDVLAAIETILTTERQEVPA